MIRTKILATLGPASSSAQTLLSLFNAGADVCRLNFSHGTLEQHAQTLANVREAAAQFDHPIAVLGDLCGPKIRLGEVADENGAGGMPINPGDQLTIQRSPTVGAGHRVSTTYPGFVDDVEIGNRLYVEDGQLRFVCIERDANEVRCQTTVGGILKTAKGINLPDTRVNLPSITERDWQCVDWAIKNDLDYLALSFVRKADDINTLREHLRSRGSDIQIIAKIEKSEGVREIDAIIEASDGLMVARGDLGVEMDVAQVPIIQKDLIRRCASAGKPVIVATQMLQSMIELASPTRAEVSDVANAIFDGTDAVMLSGETSVGKFPVGAVLTMSHIAEVTEQYLDANPHGRDPELKLRKHPLSAGIARGIRQMVGELRLKLVVLWSQTGLTAQVFSKVRFSVPIVALSSDPRALRRMALNYGVVPYKMTPAPELNDLLMQVDALVRDKKCAADGDRIVVVTGSSLGTPGMHNGVVFHTVGRRHEDHPVEGADINPAERV